MINIHNIVASYDLSVTIHVTIYFFFVTNRTHLSPVSSGTYTLVQFLNKFLVPVKEENVFPYIKVYEGENSS